MTDKEAKKIYNSSKWKRKREEILERDCYECQDCKSRLQQAHTDDIKLSGNDAKIRRATEVHHIKEVKCYPELAFDNNNLISLCTQCHNIRHGRHPKRFLKTKKKKISEEKW